jgi:lipoyl(octanoyl) transferase
VIAVRQLGVVAYADTWQAMRAFTEARTPQTRDELWLLQHAPIYTVGVAGRSEHLPRTELGIPLLKVDRGGQVTYHGPGQAIAYVLLDLRRRGLSVRELVRRLERGVLDLLAEYGVHAECRAGAPGVYVAGAKIAALGLRIRNGCSYHGVSLNVDGDLTPFQNIDPCGYPGLAVTRTADLGIDEAVERVGERLMRALIRQIELSVETTT